MKGSTLRYYLSFLAESKGFFRLRYAQLEKCRNSPLDCFSVAPFLATLGVRSHFWFESLTFELTKKDSNTKRHYYLFWRRARDSNPRNGFGRLHDFQSCSFDQLGQLSTSLIALLLYITCKEKSRENLINLFLPLNCNYIFYVIYSSKRWICRSDIVE